MTYVDGEWVNLDKIEIAGNKTVADIDMNQDGDIPKHEILVYFAKLADQKNLVYDFKKSYRLQAKQTFSIRAFDNATNTWAQGLPYVIFYQPAYYSIRFPGVQVWESRVPSVYGELP